MKKLLWLVIALWLCLVCPPSYAGGSQQLSDRLASEIIDDVEDLLSDTSGVMWAATDLLQYLNDGIVDIVFKTKCMQGTESFTLVDEQIEYSITSNYIGIEGVRFINADLKEKGLSRGNIWSVGHVDKVDEPVYWYLWNDKIGAYPAWNPNETVCNLTTFTEVDPGAKLTVAATQITFNNLTSNEDTYVYEKIDSPYFEDTFEIQFDFSLTTIDSGASVFLLTLGTAVDDYSGLETSTEEAIGIAVWAVSVVTKPYIIETVNGTTTSTLCSNVSAFSSGTTYYGTLKRTSMGSGERNISVAFYTDSTRKTLHGSEYLYAPSSNETYQFIYPIQTDNNGGTSGVTGYTRNLSYATNVDGFTSGCTITAYFIEKPSIITSGTTIPTPHIYDKALTLYIMAQAFLEDNQINKWKSLMALYEAELARARGENEPARQPDKVVIK